MQDFWAFVSILFYALIFVWAICTVHAGIILCSNKYYRKIVRLRVKRIVEHPSGSVRYAVEENFSFGFGPWVLDSYQRSMEDAVKRMEALKKYGLEGEETEIIKTK